MVFDVIVDNRCIAQCVDNEGEGSSQGEDAFNAVVRLLGITKCKVIKKSYHTGQLRYEVALFNTNHSVCAVIRREADHS